MLPASNLKQSRNCCCFLSHCLISIYLTVSISISLSLFSFILVFLLSISMAVSFSFFLRISLLSLMLALFCLTLSSLCLSLSSQFPHQFSSYHQCENTDPQFEGPQPSIPATLSIVKVLPEILHFPNQFPLLSTVLMKKEL